MPTQPIKVILTREIIEKENQEFCFKASNYLTEIINFSTHVFHMFLETTKDEFQENENLALPMQLLHAIELVDGIQELTKIGLINPGTHHVRGLFETYLNIRLLLECKETYIERSLTWLSFCTHQNVKLYKEIVRGNLQAIDVENEVKINVDINQIKDRAQKKIDNLINLLNREQFDEIETRYKKTGRVKNWYQIIDKKLDNIRAVAKRFKCEQEYLLVYKPYSTYIHGTDYQKYIKRITERALNSYILRDRSLLKEIPGWAGNWMISILRHIFITFMQDKYHYYYDWYMKDLKQFSKNIWNEEIVFE